MHPRALGDQAVDLGDQRVRALSQPGAGQGEAARGDELDQPQAVLGAECGERGGVAPGLGMLAIVEAGIDRQGALPWSRERSNSRRAL